MCFVEALLMAKQLEHFSDMNALQSSELRSSGTVLKSVKQLYLEGIYKMYVLYS